MWRPTRFVTAASFATLVMLMAVGASAAPVDYDIVYVRAPRYGDNQNSLWPDTVRPLVPDPGAVLMLLHPGGGEELLFPRAEDAGLVDAPVGNGSVADPNVSFDAQQVLFTYYHDRTDVNGQRGDLSRGGADLYVLDLPTRVVRRLTHQELTPNSGNGADFDCNRPYTNCPQVGVFNTGPAWLGDGRIVFTSSRNNFLPPQSFNGGQRVLQLFVMNADGRNVEQIGYLNQAMALHPFPLQDGRIAFSSWEGQGLRDLRQFPLWAMRPDGTQWTSLSGYSERSTVHHFMTQMRNGDIVVTRYYNLNNNGFGDLIRYPIDPPGPDYLPIDGPGAGNYPLEHKGIVRLTPFTTPEDFPAPCPGQENNPYGSATNPSCVPAQRRGKFTMPAAAPYDDLLVVYSPGPCNHNGVWDSQDRPYYDGGIYVIAGGQPIASPSQLVLVKNDPAYNEQWPRPVASYASLHGVTAPAVLPSLHNDGSEHGLDPGVPFGLVGSASLIWRDTHAAPGPPWLPPDPFNYTHEFLYEWTAQGSDAGVYADDDIYAVRIVAMEPITDRTYPNNGAGFANVGSERLRILGEIPVRKPGDPQLLHPDGIWRSDTSFLAKVPADTPITFQTLDRNAMVLNMAQTWHQVRPGEARYDCGGCHAHSKEPLDFDLTAAGQPSFVPSDLTQGASLLVPNGAGDPTVVQRAARTADVEYFRDVQPILQARCVSCHSGTTPAGQLDLNADARLEWKPWQNWPGTYYRLVLDDEARYGIAPAAGAWFAPQLTRYMRGFQSRQSLLIWKAWGARLDGRSNADRSDDIDFAGTASHPAGVGVAGMPLAEKVMLARWVDLGAPIELSSYMGYFEDDLRPTLSVGPSSADAAAAGVLTGFDVGAYDLESGLDLSSLTTTIDVGVGNLPAGANLATGTTLLDGGVVHIGLPATVSLAGRDVTVQVTVRDRAGHQTRVQRVYALAATAGVTPTLSPATASPTWTATRTATRTASPTATPTSTPTHRIRISGQVRYYGSGLPLEQASVSLQGAVPSSMQTDVLGQFAFAGVDPGDWTVAVETTDTMNGALDSLDAVYVLEAAVGRRSLSAAQRLACDVTGNGAVTALDAVFILQYAVGLIPRLPSAEHCGSDWMFLPSPAAMAGQSVLLPHMDETSCRTGAIALRGLQVDAANQDFSAVLLGDCTGGWQAAGGGGAALQSATARANVLRLGTARLTRRTGARPERVFVPLSVRGVSHFRALDFSLSYDPAQLTLLNARRLAGAQHALMQLNTSRPGVLIGALASSAPMPSGDVVVLEFARRTHHPHPSVWLTRGRVSDE